MLQPGRKYEVGSDYRYGFNGKENDNDVKGEGNQQDYGMRIYDPRLGRFLSVDPITKDYPWYTPYQFAGNKPIQYIDLDGLEEAPSKLSYDGHSFNFDPTRTKREIAQQSAQHGIEFTKAILKTWGMSTAVGADILLTRGQTTMKIVGFYYFSRGLGNIHHGMSKNPEVNKVRTLALKETISDAAIDLGSGRIAQVLAGITLATGKVVYKYIDGKSIRFSQKTVNGERLDEIINSMKEDGWQGKSINIVKMEDDIYTTFDNKRLLAADLTGTEIKANAHHYTDKLDDEMKLKIKEQYGVEAETWGDAIKLRVGDQGKGWSKGNENGKFTVPQKKYKIKDDNE